MKTAQDEEPPGTRIIPRGLKTMLPHGGLPEVVSLHLLKLIKKNGGVNGPIGCQFLSRPQLEKKHYTHGKLDPLIEDEHEVAPGLVYKYEGKFNKQGEVTTYGRALWTITRLCASYCRFCTRGREVGLPPKIHGESKGSLSKNAYLTSSEIKQVFNFLENHSEINEIILSGGDPLTAPQNYLTEIIEGLVNLQKRNKLSIIRIGTRLPVSNPISIQPWHYKLIGFIKNPYVMVHINHPAELTDETLKVLTNFRKECLATVMSQSVFLKGVNDNEDTLYQLFVNLAKEGIRPYYLYQNDPVYWAKHFTVPIKRAIKLWQNLRPRLSGVAATARFVIDTPFGFGKIPIPEGNAWKFNDEFYFDFKGKKHKVNLDKI